LLVPILLSEGIDITKTVGDPKLNAKALALIRGTVSKEVQPHIRTLTDAHASYVSLMKRFSTVDEDLRFDKLSELFLSRTGSNESVQQFIGRLKDFSLSINSVDDVIVTDPLLFTAVYNGLSDELRSSIRTWDKSSMTFESFEHKVLFECRPTTTLAPAYALQARRGADQRKPRSPPDQAPKTEQTDQKRIVCTFCSKPGHKQANRFAFKRQNVKREKANVADETILLSEETTSGLLINGNNADFDWVIDSGARSHMVKSLDLLVFGVPDQGSSCG
jgi:hypothetical protein